MKPSRLRGSFPVRSRCSLSTACSTAWAGIWKRRGPNPSYLFENSSLLYRASCCSRRSAQVLRYAQDDKLIKCHLRLDGYQVRVAGLGDVAAEARFVAVVIGRESDLFEVASGGGADYMHRS